MVPQVKVLVTRPDHLRWTPGTHVVKGETQVLQVVLWPPLEHYHTYAHTHTNVIWNAFTSSQLPKEKEFRRNKSNYTKRQFLYSNKIKEPTIQSFISSNVSKSWGFPDLLLNLSSFFIFTSRGLNPVSLWCLDVLWSLHSLSTGQDS